MPSTSPRLHASRPLPTILLSLAMLVFLLGHASAAWAGMEMVESEDGPASSEPAYTVYPTISLQDLETGHYLGATISNEQAVLDDGWGADFELLWNLQPSSTQAEDSSSATGASDALFALQSRENRLYLGVDTGLSPHPFSFEDRFITPTSKLEIIDDDGNAVNASRLMEKITHSNAGFRIRNTDEDGAVRWLSIDGDKVLATGYPAEASRFSISVKESGYSDDDLNMLTSPEWFDISEGVGYWDIQDQIGAGKADLLRTLGYSVFTNSDKAGPVYLNPNIGVDLQCSIGVKKGFRGPKVIYEVVIAFQGTGGYGNLPVDVITNISNHIDKGTGLHTGYKAAADLLWRNAANIKGTVDGKTLSLAQLISEARYSKQNAHFTLLGHSMGGAVAQCFAHTLASCGVPKSEIRGRTFESALAVSTDDPAFSDWYNIVIDTDAVSNGTVPMSIRQKVGVQRLGKTITLYDPTPDADVEGFAADAAGIAISKHDMQQAVKPMMQNLMKKLGVAVDEQITEIDTGGTWVTTISGAQSNYRPYANSGVIDDFPKAGTVVHPKGYKANKYGNRWYKLGEGGWMYEGNIMKISTYERATGRYYVASKSAPLRTFYLQEGEVVTTLKQYDEVFVDACAWNDRGNKWYHASKAGGTTGWVYSEHLLPVDPRSITDRDAIRRMEIHCPVDVAVRDSQGQTLLSIAGGSIEQSSDESRVVAEVNDDEKTVYLFGKDEYHVDILATDYGSLDYSIAGAYDEDTGAWLDARAFEDVVLEPDKLLGSAVDVAKPVEDIRLQVIDPQTGNPVAEVAPDGTETEPAPADEPDPAPGAADGTGIGAAKVSIAKAKISGIGNAVYTGKAIKPSPTVKLGGKTLRAKKDYTVSYQANKAVGTATVVVKGIGAYTGTTSKSFKILPKATSLKKATGAKKALKTSWKKVAKQVDGYQVRVALDKKFKKGAKTITVKKAKATSAKVAKLKSGKRYYVQVRTYKVVGGKKYCSAWSKAKAAKTK